MSRGFPWETPPQLRLSARIARIAGVLKFRCTPINELQPQVRLNQSVLYSIIDIDTIERASTPRHDKCVVFQASGATLGRERNRERKNRSGVFWLDKASYRFNFAVTAL